MRKKPRNKSQEKMSQNLPRNSLRRLLIDRRSGREYNGGEGLLPKREISKRSDFLSTIMIDTNHGADVGTWQCFAYGISRLRKCKRKRERESVPHLSKWQSTAIEEKYNNKQNNTRTKN